MDGKLPTFADLSVTWGDMSGCCQRVHNKLATSHCNGIWETTRHNRHNGLLPTPTCYRLGMGNCHLVADSLRTCRLYCGLVMDLLATQWGSCQLVTKLLCWNWCNGFWPLTSCPLDSQSSVACCCLLVLSLPGYTAWWQRQAFEASKNTKCKWQPCHY